jgi:hypothetical protein
MTKDFGRHLREVAASVDRFQAMYRVGSALIFAELTTRPAYREIIDTLQWGEIR